MAKNKDDINIPDEIERLLDSDPFKPFVVITTSGDRYPITRKHAVAVGGSVVILITPAAKTSIYLRTNQIVGLEIGTPTRSK
jgi:hypothetical protein